MAKILNFPTHKDERGKLSVIEKIANFKIRRIFYIYDLKKTRGGHKHKKTKQLILCLSGSCELKIKNKKKKLNKTYILNKPSRGVFLDPDDWHTMKSKKKNTILLVLCSEYFNKRDYLYKL